MYMDTKSNYQNSNESGWWSKILLRERPTSDMFAIFGDTNLLLTYVVCMSYAPYTTSDFPWHTYLPQNRTSFMDVP